MLMKSPTNFRKPECYSQNGLLTHEFMYHLTLKTIAYNTSLTACDQNKTWSLIFFFFALYLDHFLQYGLENLGNFKR